MHILLFPSACFALLFNLKSRAIETLAPLAFSRSQRRLHLYAFRYVGNFFIRTNFVVQCENLISCLLNLTGFRFSVKPRHTCALYDLLLINLPPVEFKHHHLCALSHLLRWIPKQVLLSEVPRVSADSSLHRVVACEARLSLT